MPMFMDVHKNLKGINARAAADAHVKDLQVQEKYGVKYHKYWVNETEGLVYCLVEAPTKESANTVHREATGMVADEIHEVTEGQ